DLVKVVKNMAEDGRIAVRAARRAARQELDKLSKDGDASSDDVVRAEKQVDQLTHDREHDINAALAQKEQELLEV
ncbi:MAG: ribosome recycling factor, partial [Acidimicrobiales bacterium]